MAKKANRLADMTRNMIPDLGQDHRVSQTITIKCECAEAMRELKTAIEKLTTILTTNSNGKPSKEKDQSEHSGDHGRISIQEFAKRKNVTRQTVYKWIANHKLPPRSWLLSPEGRYEIDWDVYKNGYVIVR